MAQTFTPIGNIKGAKGDTGPGVPDGGTGGQILAKVDGTDQNTEWVDPTGGGSGTVQSVNGVGPDGSGDISLPLIDTAVQPGELATIATSGLYTDLDNAPIFAAIALSGDYADLLNKPTLGTAASHAATDFDVAGAAAAAQAAAVAASQPLDSDLTAIAALTTTAFGRTLLTMADAAAVRTNIGLGTLATQSGDITLKADLVAGLVPTSQLPAVALNHAPRVVVNRAALLALTGVTEGSPAVVTGTADQGTYMLDSSGDPTVFAHWLLLKAPTDVVSSVNGQTGIVVLGYADVGADQSGAASAAQAAAIAASQPLDADLTAIAALATTSYGRGFLTLANAAAGRTLLALGTAATSNTGDFDAAGAAAAVQAAAVLLTTNQTIAGVKTFTNGIKSGADIGISDGGVLTSPAGHASFQFSDVLTGGHGGITVKGNMQFEAGASLQMSALAIQADGSVWFGNKNAGFFMQIAGAWASGSAGQPTLAPTTGTWSVEDTLQIFNADLTVCDWWVCINGGTPGTWIKMHNYDAIVAAINAKIVALQAESDGDRLTSGQETVSRELATTIGTQLTTGALRLTYFTARKTETLTKIRFLSGTTAAGATPTLVKYAVFSVAANGDLTRIAVTASTTSAFAAANAAYEIATTASYALTAGTRYAIGVLVISGAAMPSLVTAGAAGGVTSESDRAPRICGQVATQTDILASYVNTLVTGSGLRLYAVAVP